MGLWGVRGIHRQTCITGSQWDIIMSHLVLAELSFVTVFTGETRKIRISCKSSFL